MTKRASNLSNKRYSCKHLISTDGTKIYVKFVSDPTERDTKMLLILGIYGRSVFNYYNLLIY